MRSIPEKGNIPPSIRSSSTIKSHIPRNLTISKQRISIDGFVEKLKWLKDHLAELEKNAAPIEIMEDVRAQIERLQELLGIKEGK